MAERTITIQVPDDVSPHELERLARCASTTDAARLFLDQAAAAIREDRQKPIKLERISQYEWRVDGKIVRLRPRLVPAVVTALSKPTLEIFLDDIGGKRKAYRRHYQALLHAQAAITKKCGDGLGRLAERVTLRSDADGAKLSYLPRAGDPPVHGSSNVEDLIAARIPTPKKPRKARAKVYDRWVN